MFERKKSENIQAGDRVWVHGSLVRVQEVRVIPHRWSGKPMSVELVLERGYVQLDAGLEVRVEGNDMDQRHEAIYEGMKQ